MAIFFVDHEVRSGLKEKRRLARFLKERVAVYRPGTRKADLNYVFCSDDYLLELNQSFLQHDTLTDILTFDLSTKGSPDLAGEIYISVDCVSDNAKLFKTTYSEELHRVIFHGMLHLCGFKDKRKQDILEMRRREQECLDLYQLEQNATGHII